MRIEPRSGPFPMSYTNSDERMSRGRHANVAGTSPSSKLAVVGITGALLGVIWFSQVWVPTKSSEAAYGRERTAALGGEHAADIAPGSVWKNMSKQRDFLGPGERKE